MFQMEKNTENSGDILSGAELNKGLESIFTIDGRGRPAKAQLFLLLIQKYGEDEVINGVEEISRRKFM